MSSFRFLVIIIKRSYKIAIPLLARIIGGRSQNYVEEALHFAFMQIALAFLNNTDKLNQPKYQGGTA